MDVDLIQRSVDGCGVLEVHGEVDVHSASTVSGRLIQLIDSGGDRLVLDLSRLTFIDSTGLGALVAARNHSATAGVSLRLVCKTDRVLKLFRITGLDQVFDIYPNLTQATVAPGQPENPAHP